MTLMQQWAVAAVLAIIPLLLAVSYAVLSLQHQTNQQRALVQELDGLSTRTSALSENVRDLVRAARQYLLLRDQGFLDQYQQKSSALETLAGEVRATLAENGLTRGGETGNRQDIGMHLDNVLAIAGDVGRRLVSGDLDSDQLGGRIQSLVAGTDALVVATGDYRHDALSRGEREFNRIVDQLFVLTALALPGTILMMMIGSFMVSRPIWRLSQAIRRFGRHQWRDPVSIRGPADLVALGDSLEWMRQQVLASDRQKTAFIRHVTHELKTPLAAIIEAASLLDDQVVGSLDDDQRAIVAILRDNARNLEELIQQLLNYNAVSHGMVAQVAPVAVGEVCGTVARQLDMAKPDSARRWTIAGKPATLPGDPRLLDMILRNLMGNAWRFSPAGGEITVTWGREAEHWWLAVADQGPGIAEDELDDIFTPFFRGSASRLDSAPRNGIGLAIVDEAVKLMGGNIAVDSRPGHGARFTIRLPLSGQDAAA